MTVHDPKALDALAMPFKARLSVEDFVLLDRAGAFDAYVKTELIDGAIVAMNAQYSEHFTVKVRLLRRLADACDAMGGGLQAWSEGSLAIPPHAVPEPDVFVTDVEPVTGLVPIDTVRLVVEIASTTLDQDMGPKRTLYAGAMVPEYWVVDVKAQVIHQFWSPANGHYADAHEIRFGDPLTSATIAELTIATTGF